jgi:hypothetical protein
VLPGGVDPASGATVGVFGAALGVLGAAVGSLGAAFGVVGTALGVLVGEFGVAFRVVPGCVAPCVFIVPFVDEPGIAEPGVVVCGLEL